MKAILIKNNAWGYVSGDLTKPKIIAGDAASMDAVKRWTEGDLKVQSDIILAITPSELKPVKGCATAREVWKKLEEIHQSKEPVRKAILRNRLISHKMQDDDDARQSTQEFIDTVVPDRHGLGFRRFRATIEQHWFTFHLLLFFLNKEL